MREPSLCTIRRAAPPVITKVSADVLPSMKLIVVDATLRDLIHRQAGELELERYVRQHLWVSAVTALRKCSPEKPL